MLRQKSTQATATPTPSVIETPRGYKACVTYGDTTFYVDTLDRNLLTVRPQFASLYYTKKAAMKAAQLAAERLA